MQEREINLVDLFVEVLLRWRMFIIWMVCGAVLLGTYSYVKSSQAANAQAAQVEAAKRQLEEGAIQEGTTDVDLALLEKTSGQLTDIQRRTVEAVVAYEKWLSSQEGSALLQIDANNVQQAVVTFHISSESKELSYSIEAVYEDVATNGEMAQYIADRLDMSSYVSDLLSLHKEELMQVGQNYIISGAVNDLKPSDSFSIRVIHYDEQVCRDMAQAVIDFVEGKQGELSGKMGEHDLILVNSGFSVVYDSDLAAMQYSLLTNITSTLDNVLRRKNAFSDTEWRYYDVLINGKITGVNSTDTVLQSPADIVARGITVTPDVSLKYVLLGMAIAIFVYGIYVVVIYIFNTKLRATDNLQELYAIPQLGLIPAERAERRIFGFVDKWIESLRNRNKRSFTREEAAGLAAVAVKMATERNENKSVYLLGCNLKAQALALCEQLRDILGKDNIQVVILNNVLYDAAALNSLENAEGVVLVEKAKSTLYVEIEQELDLLRREDITILGGILVE